MIWVFGLAFLSGVALFLAHVVVLPYHQEDEAMLRENLEDTRRSPFAEKYMSIVLAMEAGDESEQSRQSSAYRGGESPSLRGQEGHRSSTWLC